MIQKNLCMKYARFEEKKTYLYFIAAFKRDSKYDSENFLAKNMLHKLVVQQN